MHWIALDWTERPSRQVRLPPDLCVPRLFFASRSLLGRFITPALERPNRRCCEVTQPVCLSCLLALTSCHQLPPASPSSSSKQFMRTGCHESWTEQDAYHPGIFATYTLNPVGLRSSQPCHRPWTRLLSKASARGAPPLRSSPYCLTGAWTTLTMNLSHPPSKGCPRKLSSSEDMLFLFCAPATRLSSAFLTT